MFNPFKKTASDMHLLVGLGNPGDKYKGNRHNIGFMAVDTIAEEYAFPAFRSKFQGKISEGKIEGRKVALLKPQTMMNNSGQSVKAAAKFFKIPIDNVIVFHDELDLEPRKIRVKLGGGNAGHNGLRSIQAHLGTPDFVRVRLGIGHPGDKNKVHSYVLKDFPKADQKRLVLLLDAIASHANLIVENDGPAFMSKIAQNFQEEGV